MYDLVVRTTPKLKILTLSGIVISNSTSQALVFCNKHSIYDKGTWASINNLRPEISQNKNKDSEPGFQSQSLQVVCSDINQRIEQSNCWHRRLFCVVRYGSVSQSLRIPPEKNLKNLLRCAIDLEKCIPCFQKAHILLSTS